MRLLKDKKIIAASRCPICKAAIEVRESGSIVCRGAKTHCYDIASSGYVNFCSPTQSGGGDSKAAVRARTAFLDSGAYEPVAREIQGALNAYCNKNGLVLDAGCGEGYYSSFAASEGFSVIGADISKFAVDAAAKRLGRAGYENSFFETASVFELPMHDSSADAVINIFAPCVEQEFSRVLKNGGILVVAWAGEEHLLGLKRAIYDNVRQNTERADMPQGMELLSEKHVRYDIELDTNERILDLFSMTPYYWRTSTEDRDKLLNISSLRTEIDVIVSVYKNNK